MRKINFVDFDDTLALHRCENKASKFYLADPVTMCNELYRNSEVNMPLYEYLLERQEKGEEFILLSNCSSMVIEGKKVWLAKNMPLLKFKEFYGTSIDISKTEVMIYYAELHPEKDILLIDDNCQERWSAEAAGIKTLNPQLLMLRQYRKNNLKIGNTNV